AGSWFYDPEDVPMPSTVKWGDGVTKWGDGVTKWGGQPKLYVWLADSSNPYDTTVVVSVGIYLSTEGIVFPELGPTKYSGGVVTGTVVSGKMYRVSGSYQKLLDSSTGIVISDQAHTASLSSDGRATVAYNTAIKLKATGPETRRFFVDIVSPWS